MKVKSTAHKHFMFSALLMILVSWNGSMINTTTGKRPDVNFYGVLVDHAGSCKVEDILIGQKYEQIPVYQPIQGATTEREKLKSAGEKTVEIDPKQNKSLLDLREVQSISLIHPDRPSEHELLINNQRYTEIEVVLITGSKNHYIIESSREISCLKIDKGPNADQAPVTEERKLNIIHVKELKINGYKAAQEQARSVSREAQVSEKTEVATSTEKILDQIEEKVNNLPKDDSKYAQIKESLVALLRALRDQVQKMLSMIKN